MNIHVSISDIPLVISVTLAFENLHDEFLLFQRVMPLVLKELLSSEATNRRNAAFCVGELCKNGGEPTLRYSFCTLYI